jgi:hypothetical protein
MTTKFKKLCTQFFSLFGWNRRLPSNENSEPTQYSDNHDIERIDAPETSNFVPYDENLLERSRTQWQFGDWESLCALSRNELQHHPDRSKLAILAAAGHQQIGEMSETKAWVRLASEWGCSQRLIRQILIAGAQNTIARAAALSGLDQKALLLFEAAVDSGSPNADRLVKQARVAHQFEQLGLTSPKRSSLVGSTQSPSKD